jgi:uncharacterized protein YbjQ (UPF0145 family)
MDNNPTRQTPYQVAKPVYSVAHHMVTTAFEIPGFRVVQNLGVVRGITVRSRSVFGTIGAGLQTMVGGNISIYTKLCEQAREEAYEILIQHASEIGANAIIGVRYDANEIQAGVTEVLCYGTAVIVQPLERETGF